VKRKGRGVREKRRKTQTVLRGDLKSERVTAGGWLKTRPITQQKKKDRV
jgi:hypothetical protein